MISLKLYTYYRSTAAYRVRIALNFKNLPYEAIPINLINAEQLTSSYREHNPQGRVPTLQDGNITIGQSLAILEYLEEVYPTPALLPKDSVIRAHIRYITQIIASDIHPLNNLSVLQFLKNTFDISSPQITTWCHHWLKAGFDAIEKTLSTHNTRGKCCVGDHITFADICLIPQIYNANRFAFAMTDYPILSAINDYCLSLAYVKSASPEEQPDASNSR